MTAEELKVIISADDSKFSKAINNINKSLNSLNAKNLESGLDASEKKANRFQIAYQKAMAAIDKANHKTSATVKKKWLSELDDVIKTSELRLKYLSKMFEQFGYSDFWGGRIDDTDAYYRKLKELRDLVSNNVIDIDTGNLDKIPDIVHEVTSSIENIDLKMQATIDVDADQLKASEGVIHAIEEALDEIDNIKLNPITPESIALIKEYRKVIDSLVSQWAKLNKTAVATKWSTFSSASPAQSQLYARYQESANIKASRDDGGKLGKIGLTIAKAMAGVQGLYMLIRKIIIQNENFTTAIQLNVEAIAAILKPALDFIANLLAGFAKIVGRIFGVAVGIGSSSAATASNTEKALTIASFDELNVLSKTHEGGVAGGVSGGAGGWLEKLDAKLEKIYTIIDKVKQFIKDNLPGGPNRDELGVPRETQAAYNQVYGDTSIGYNVIPVVTGGEVNLINVAEIEQGAQKWSNFFARVKEGWSKLKETVSKNGEAIAESNRLTTDAQVTKWNEWKDKVKAKWDELKTKIFGDNNEIANSNSMLSTSALQAWETLKQGAKNKWQEIKQKIFGDNAEIAQNNLSLSDILSNAWENIKINATEKWNNLKTTINQKLEDIKTKIRGVPDALSGWASSAWGYVRNFANNIITGIESAINNVIWKINNSGVANVLNRVFGGGFYVSPIWIPRLAKGGVIDTPTLAQVGEYPGAHSNKEIVAPQSILKETIDASNGQLATVFAQGIRQIISAIDNKDLEVSIDDTTIAKSAARGNRQWQLQTGGSLF